MLNIYYGDMQESVFLKEKIREIIEGTSILHIVTEQDRKKKPDEILP